MLRSLFSRVTGRLLRTPFAGARLVHDSQLTAPKVHPGGGISYPQQVTTAAEAVAVIESGNSVYVHGTSAMPQALVSAMADRADLRDVIVHSIHTEGPARFASPEKRHQFTLRAFFLGANVRPMAPEGVVEYIPCHLNEVPRLFRSGTLPIDVALISVSPPDRHGYCSLGVSVAETVAAVQMAKTVVAQVNPHMPRTYGDGQVHVSQIDVLFEHSELLPTHAVTASSEVGQAIGKHVVSLVQDGATLQMGIGDIPNAVLANLTQHQRLGVHTEMFSDGLLPLLRAGNVTNEQKKIRRGKTVVGFVVGSQELYDFVNDNVGVDFCDISFVNDPNIICMNPQVTSINSAIEVDLTGQICADSIGTRMYSGTGGQVDFVRAANNSDGGRAIIALPSRTAKGRSRIAATLQLGAGVVTPRPDARFVVTEYGAVDLRGLSLQQRARKLISIAHPDDREALHKAAFERFGRHFGAM